jgi:DNA polymerase-3 subunit epsilon
MEAPIPWHRGKSAAFDLETTGVDTATDRIVTASFIELNAQTRTIEKHEWLINPGIVIPEGATSVHGVTTEHARENGRDPREVIAEINGKLNAAYAAGIPVFGFNVSYDLSLLHNESTRNGLVPGQPRRIVDVAVLDKRLDQYRKGGRKLTDVCRLYGVPLDAAHTADADALGTARVGWKMVEKYPELLQIDLDALHEKQKTWRADQCAGLQTYYRRSKNDESITIAPQWPVILPGDDPDASKSPHLSPVEAPKKSNVPAGRYALRADDGTVRFFIVDIGTTGKWAGVTFLKRQAGDDELPVKGAARAQVMDAIEKDPKAAAILYGKELGVCGMCGKTLTNPESIESGIGPVCITKF